MEQGAGIRWLRNVDDKSSGVSRGVARGARRVVDVGGKKCVRTTRKLTGIAAEKSHKTKCSLSTNDLTYSCRTNRTSFVVPLKS